MAPGGLDLWQQSQVAGLSLMSWSLPGCVGRPGGGSMLVLLSVSGAVVVRARRNCTVIVVKQDCRPLTCNSL